MEQYPPPLHPVSLYVPYKILFIYQFIKPFWWGVGFIEKRLIQKGEMVVLVLGKE